MKDGRPLSEVVPQVAELNLSPAVPADDILFNASAIGRVAGWGCLEKEVVFEDLDIPAELSDFDISPIIAKEGLAKREVFTVLAHVMAHVRPRLSIGLDFVAMHRQLSEAGSARSPESWSELLNRHVTQELLGAAKYQLTESVQSFVGFWWTSLVALEFTEFPAVASLIQGRPQAILAGLGVPGAVVLENAAKAYLVKKAGLPLREAGFSLIPGKHYDRLAFARLAAKRTLVHAA